MDWLWAQQPSGAAKLADAQSAHWPGEDISTENRIHALGLPAVYLIEDENSGAGGGEAGDEPEGRDSALEAARAGDRTAFDLLMRRHERLVLGTAYRLAGKS